jgi:hypothetical protein
MRDVLMQGISVEDEFRPPLGATPIEITQARITFKRNILISKQIQEAKCLWGDEFITGLMGLQGLTTYGRSVRYCLS